MLNLYKRVVFSPVFLQWSPSEQWRSCHTLRTGWDWWAADSWPGHCPTRFPRAQSAVAYGTRADCRSSRRQTHCRSAAVSLRRLQTTPDCASVPGVPPRWHCTPAVCDNNMDLLELKTIYRLIRTKQNYRSIISPLSWYTPPGRNECVWLKDYKYEGCQTGYRTNWFPWNIAP